MTAPTATRADTAHRDRSDTRRRRTKGILALAAGAALLIGSGTTYALWSSQQALEGEVQTGDLNLSLGTATWTIDGLLTTPAPVADPAAVRIVPGDVLTLAQTVTVTLVGDTIGADLGVDVGAVIPAGLEDHVTVAFAATGLGTANPDGSYRVTEDTDGDIQASVTITFDADTPDREGVNAEIDLTGIVFALEQAST